MSKHDVPDPVDKVMDAYGSMIDALIEKGGHLGETIKPRIDQAVQTVRKQSDFADALHDHDWDDLREAAYQDLSHAADFLESQGKEFRQWLGFELERLEWEFLDRFFDAADNTRTELLQWSKEAERQPYQTGQVASPGTFRCTHCQQVIHLHKAGRIPPCPKCHKTQFNRLVDSSHE